MSSQELDGATAMMISADPAALFALGCDSGEVPAPGDKSRSVRAWVARVLNLRMNAAMTACTNSERSL